MPQITETSLLDYINFYFPCKLEHAHIGWRFQYTSSKALSPSTHQALHSSRVGLLLWLLETILDKILEKIPQGRIGYKKLGNTFWNISHSPRAFAWNPTEQNKILFSFFYCLIWGKNKFQTSSPAQAKAINPPGMSPPNTKQGGLCPAQQPEHTRTGRSSTASAQCWVSQVLVLICVCICVQSML